MNLLLWPNYKALPNTEPCHLPFPPLPVFSFISCQTGIDGKWRGMTGNDGILWEMTGNEGMWREIWQGSVSGGGEEGGPLQVLGNDGSRKILKDKLTRENFCTFNSLGATLKYEVITEYWSGCTFYIRNSRCRCLQLVDKIFSSKMNPLPVIIFLMK